MRYLFVILFILVSLNTYSQNDQDRWIFYYENNSSDFYYDKESLISSDNKLTVWGKWVARFTDIDPVDNVEIDYTLNEYEFFCDSREYRWVRQVIIRTNNTQREIDFKYNVRERISTS